MLLQVILRTLIVAVVTVNVQANLNPPKHCADCEEEVWEEIPCNALHTISTTTVVPSPTTHGPPVTTIRPQTSTQASTPGYPVIGTTTTSPPEHGTPSSPIESSEGFKNCYCECKSGCKEFCRKTILNPDQNKQILHISKTKHPHGYKNIEVTHTHERNVVASSSSSSYPSDSSTSGSYDNKQQLPQLAYVGTNPVYNAVPASEPHYKASPAVEPYPLANEGYSYDDLAKIFNSDSQYSHLIREPSIISYPLPSLPSIDQKYPHAQPAYSQNSPYTRPVTYAGSTGSAPAYAIASQVRYLRRAHTNDIRGTSYLPAIHSYPSYDPSYALAPSSSAGAQASVSNAEKVAETATTPDTYKTSSFSKYISKNTNQPSVKISEIPMSKPVSMRHTDTPTNLNRFQDMDSAVDKYLEQILYLDPHRKRS